VVEILANNDFKRMWKEEIAVQSKYCPYICMERMRETTTNFIMIFDN
jgi:hypothetical protein